MANQWFRMYSEVLEDPKVQRLSAENFRYWVNILCIVSRQNTPELPPLHDLAFMLRLSEKATVRVIDELVDANLLEHTENGLEPHNWRKRQYKSDVSTARVKRHRAKNETLHETPMKRFSNGESTVSVTPPETETETETESVLGTERGAHTHESAESQVKEFDYNARSRFVPDNFTPDEMFHATHRHRNPAANYHLELERFKAYEFTTAKSDWQRAWISWWLRAKPDTTNDTRNSLERQTDELLGIDRRYV